jgi:hypothetical protein
MKLWQPAIIVDKRLGAVIPPDSRGPVPGMMELLQQVFAGEQALSAVVSLDVV